MSGLNSHDWSQSFRDALDRHITGNYGEDQFIGDPMNVEPTQVYIGDASEGEGWLALYHAFTQERMSDRPEKNRHNLVELATANGWELTDGPLNWESGHEDYPDDDPGFDPMFLL